jgi:Ras family protein
MSFPFGTQEAQVLADSWKVPYRECSSKTAANVAEVFHTLMKEIEKDDGLLETEEEEGCIIL